MNDLALYIYDLIQSEGKSADKITHALANIGDGKMDAGIKRLADFFMKTGSAEGEKHGFIKGVGITLCSITAVGAVHYLKKNNEKKRYEAEGKAVLKALEEE